MNRRLLFAVVLALFAFTLAGCGGTSADTSKAAGSASKTAGSDQGASKSEQATAEEKADAGPYAAIDASGANERKAIAALPKVLDMYRKNEPAEDQVDITGVEPQLVAYEVQLDMKQPNGKLTIWQFDVSGDKIVEDDRLSAVTMKDMQSGMPAAAPLSDGEKTAAEAAAGAIVKGTPSARPAHAGIVKYWFFYDAGEKGNLLIAVGPDGFYRGSTFAGK